MLVSLLANLRNYTSSFASSHSSASTFRILIWLLMFCI